MKNPSLLSVGLVLGAIVLVLLAVLLVRKLIGLGRRGRSGGYRRRRFL